MKTVVHAAGGMVVALWLMAGVIQAGQEQGRIIFISGSCSSGKSSLATLVAQELDASYFAFDEYVMPLVLKKIVEGHVGKFLAPLVSKLVVSNFFTFVGFLSDKQKYKFQKKFYKQLQQGIALEPTQSMYREAKALALQGHDVVIEAPLQLGEGVDCTSSLLELDGLAVTYVLAYCPWHKLVERIKQRNSNQNKKTHRELDWAIANFNHCFSIKTAFKPGALDSVQGSMVRTTIVKHANSAYRKKRLYLLEETRRQTLAIFNSDNLFYVYPRFDYNLVVDTCASTPEQGAAHVLRYLRKANGHLDRLKPHKSSTSLSHGA